MVEGAAVKTSDAGLQLIMQAEGFRENAYPDPGTGGEPWTIGYGHTLGVRPGDSCTQAEAAQWLREDVVKAENAVMSNVDVALQQCQFDALVSFVFNVGPKAFMDSTLLRKLNAGDLDGAAAEFPKWCHAGTRILPGLVKRRAAEQAMFMEGVQA